jgi:hypothetical protein
MSCNIFTFVCLSINENPPKFWRFIRKEQTIEEMNKIDEIDEIEKIREIGEIGDIGAKGR